MGVLSNTTKILDSLICTRIYGEGINKVDCRPDRFNQPARSVIEKVTFKTFLIVTAIRETRKTAYPGIVVVELGSFYCTHVFKSARDEYGLEVHFPVNDEDFLALELTEDSLYRRSGFLIYPNTFQLKF
jgi:hypothetical protein